MDSTTVVDLNDMCETVMPEASPSELERDFWKRFGTIGFDAYARWVLSNGSSQLNQSE